MKNSNESAISLLFVSLYLDWNFISYTFTFSSSLLSSINFVPSSERNNKSSRYYQLEKHTLQEVQDNPYLGLQISNDLKWSIHINKVCKKADATLGFLRRNLRNVPEAFRKTAYVTLVRSIMEYGATTWNPYLKGDIEKLERIQNRAIRFVKKDYKSRETGAITRMREDLEIETLEKRRLSLRLILMYKVVEGLVPEKWLGGKTTIGAL